MAWQTDFTPISSVDRAIGFYPTGQEFESLIGDLQKDKNNDILIIRRQTLV